MTRTLPLGSIRAWTALTIVTALVVLVFALMPRAHAQDANAIEYTYPENGTHPVATFTATDPEGVTPIAWDIVEDATDPDSDGNLTAADNADAASFTIDKDGALKFSSSSGPDYENPAGTNATNNTYKVVVVACDVALESNACPDTAKAGYHKVTVMVTNLDEPGKVTLATDTEDGTPQYVVGATLTATASDGDITDATQTFTANRAGEVTGVTWRWYRGANEISGATSNDYTLVQDDAGEHIRAVVYYVVEGSTGQETAGKTTDYPVLAGRVGDNALKFAPATISRTITEGAKDRNVGAPVTATGNHGIIRYSLAGDGADNGIFDIDAKTGQITTDVVLDYEGAGVATADAAGSCAGADGTTPDRECIVTVRATDATGSATATTASPGIFVDATVTITITDVDEKPAFTGTGGAQTVSVPENSTALFGLEADGYNQDVVEDVTYTAADPEGRTVSYSLAGPDASKFQLSSDPPVLSFVSGADFEAKASADGDNVYEVTIRATVGSATGERMVRVTVGNVNEGPEISGPSTKSFPENSKDSVGTFTATDPEGATSIAWFIAAAGADPDGNGGPLADTDAADAEHFAIDKDGVLKFDAAPDHENPSGEGATSNTYRVVVAACDVALESDACPGTAKAGYYKVTVMVTNLDEQGKVTLATDTEDGTPQYLVGAALTATAKDGDITDTDQDFTDDRSGEVDGVTWLWYRGGGRITGANTNEYTLVQADANNRIRVEVRYQVDGNTNQERASLTTDYPVLAARVGDNALKFDPATVSSTITEGAKDRNVGAPVTATGNHGTIRYSLADSGDATAGTPKFKIDDKTGQISTAVALNYEAGAGAEDNCVAKNSCTVTVTATDSTGEAATNSATVTIKITDVDEKPAFTGTGGAQTVSVPENSTDLFGLEADGYNQDVVEDVTYTAADPEGRTVSYSLAGPDASKFQLSGSPPVLSFVSGADFEAKASADGDNVYEVTIRASAGTLHEDRMVRVTVGNVDEAPVIMAAPTAGLRISGPASQGYPENGTGAIATYRASGPNAASARWSLTGDDAGDFRLSTSTGASVMLMFSSSPDYENPADDDSDNVYMVTLSVTDGSSGDTHEVAVTVTDVTEDSSGETLLERYDADDSGSIEKSEMIKAINDYLFGTGADAITKEQMIEVINLYLFG